MISHLFAGYQWLEPLYTYKKYVYIYIYPQFIYIFNHIDINLPSRWFYQLPNPNFFPTWTGGQHVVSLRAGALLLAFAAAGRRPRDEDAEIAGARQHDAAHGRGNAAPGSGDVADRGGGAQPTAEGQQVEGAEGANGMRGYERCHGLRS